MGSSRDDLREFPEVVRYVMGYALYLAQTGGKHPDAKPLSEFGGASVLEVAEDYDSDTYRAVYTVPLGSPTLSTCYTPSRRSPSAGLPLRSATWS